MLGRSPKNKPIMTSLRSTTKWLVLMAAAIAGLFSGQLASAISTSVGKSGAMLIVFILLIFVLRIVQFLIENLARNSRTFRRIINGKSDIEGYWIDHSFDQEGTLVGIACIYIEFSGDTLLVSGSTFKTESDMYASWDTKFATLQGRTLSYAFESHTSSANSPVELGYAELKFSRGAKAPQSYSGFFFDTTHKSLICLQGLRVTDSKVIRELESPQKRYEFLREKHSSNKKMENKSQ